MSSSVFQINDYLIYGGSGVCVVEDICVPEINGLDPTKEYYILRPIYDNGGTIFSPVDNTRNVMRRLITRDEVSVLWEKLSATAALWNATEKIQESDFLSVIRTYDPFDWACIIKSLHERVETRIRQKKSIGETDKRYLRMTEDLLYGELAVALDIPKDQVSEYFCEKLRGGLV